ncbi:DNA-processing protein DprA [Synechococcus elongatus]|uniref:DNA-processing protein DprA n=1 Tax=Synechococcus elongatus PCC 11802 TaxID=2283154 RepID=A0AAT9K020_SYNEL|nr:DNA-processing protein DprA [Synechococcus elongatus]QFZ93131.1 DNA-protecting protein DprA [Synechococcus elongatus PCC 11802]
MDLLDSLAPPRSQRSRLQESPATMRAMPDAEALCCLALVQVPRLGSALLRRLLVHFGSFEAAWQAPTTALLEVDGIGLLLAEAIATLRRQLQPEAFWEQHQRQNPHFLLWTDPAYPRLLREIPTPPPVLYYRGNLDLIQPPLDAVAIGIVGTRDPSPYGRRWTGKLSGAIAQAGYTVISGLAYGVDTEAHQACLEARGKTVAVLGTGVNVIYPPQNRALYEAILEQGGLILSEQPSGTQPDRGAFPARNRIIAGLSRALLVTEAPGRSGALITAHLANEFCRDVYILPNSLDNPKAAGCLSLIQQGAQPILGAGHLLDWLRQLPPLDPQSQPLIPSAVPSQEAEAAIADLTTEQAQVYAILSDQPISKDEIVERSGLDFHQVQIHITHLEILGLVEVLPSDFCQRC